MNYCNFKKHYAVIFCIMVISLIFCSCSVNIENNEENTTDKILTEKTNSDIDLSNCYFYDVKVLSNGDYIKFYITNDEDSLLKYMEIINAENSKVKSTIDISKYYMKNVNFKCLDNSFYIYGNEIGVYDYNGMFIKSINYPKDIEQSISDYTFALSNDLSKMVYYFKIEDEEEDKIGIKLLDLNTNKETVIQNLNEPVTDKPCDYNSLHFSADDKKVMFLGQRYLTINNGKDCYGVIDLNSLSIKSDFVKDSYCCFVKDSGYVYDKNVEYGKNSSGEIIKFDQSGNAETILLENKNESQHIGLTDNENMFLSILCNRSDYSIEIKLYENGKAIKKSDIKCKDEEEFNLINVDNVCYSSKSNKVYYSSIVWNGDEYMGNEYFELEMK